MECCWSWAVARSFFDELRLKIVARRCCAAPVRKVARSGPNGVVMSAPVRRAARSGRPKGLSRATCPLWPERVARWPPTGDRKALGSGAIAHANWRGSVDISMFCRFGGHIFGINDPIYDLINVLAFYRERISRFVVGVGEQKRGLSACAAVPKSTLVRSYCSAEAAGSRLATRSSIHWQISL